jgi:AcrR family transcriptional regulator
MSSASDDGRSTRWDEHREQRRVELVEAAVAAIDLHGPTASVAEMAEQAGVSKPVLYRYFADKDELYAAVGQYGADLVLERVVPELFSGAPLRESIHGAVEAYLTTIEEHPQVFALLVRHHSEGHDPLADGKLRIAALLARSLNDLLRRLRVDAGGAEPWAHGIVGLFVSAGDWWLERDTMSREAVCDYLTGFVWHALEGLALEYGVPASLLDQPTSETIDEA